MVRLDWYQCTLSGPSIPDLRACLGQMVPQPYWEPQKRARQGYGFADHLQGPDGCAAQILWGGTHQLPHVVLSGEDAEVGAALLREAWPETQAVTRADACIDYADPGAYDRLQELALGVAQSEGIKVGTAGDHLVTMKGRTVYLGAPSSHTRLRIYDKGEQLRQQFAKDPARLATVPEHLARFECQVRPQTPQARYAASKAQAMELMGSARWMRVLMRQVADVELQPFNAGKVWRQSDHQRAYHHMLVQYGPLLKRMGAVQGWECLGLQLRDDLADRAAR